MLQKQGQWKVVKSDEARSSEAWRAKVKNPKGRGMGGVLGQAAASSPLHQL